MRAHLLAVILSLATLVCSVPVAERAVPTSAPLTLRANPTPDDLYSFYSPKVKRQADNPPVPLSELGPPKFPADIPSCPKCEANYGSLSNCMGAAAVFANATSIFNDPFAYINVIRCACTDTFQSVFPQCVDCFQHTDQCYYIGTDPKGTGAPSLITNIRNICGFGSALLGGVASANSNVGTNTPTAPGSYYDVSTTGWGYNDQSTGDIFQLSGATRIPMTNLSWGIAVVLATTLAIVGGGWRTFANA